MLFRGPARRRAEILNRLKRGESVDHFDTIRVRKDGSLFRFPSRFLRSESAEGASWRLENCHDITSRKKTEAV